MQSREGLNIGLAVTVRYRLDPEQAGQRAGAPAAAGGQGAGASGGGQCVAGTGAGVHGARDLLDQARRGAGAAARIITQKLAADGIVVEEVMLSDIQLPEEYAKGLEGLLLKEQQDDQMAWTPKSSRSRCGLPSCKPRPRQRRR